MWHKNITSVRSVRWKGTASVSCTFFIMPYWYVLAVPITLTILSTRTLSSIDAEVLALSLLLLYQLSKPVCNQRSLDVILFLSKVFTAKFTTQFKHLTLIPSSSLPSSLPSFLPLCYTRRMWSCQTLSLQSSKIFWRGCCREMYPRGSAARAVGMICTHRTHLFSYFSEDL